MDLKKCIQVCNYLINYISSHSLTFADYLFIYFVNNDGEIITQYIKNVTLFETVFN